MRIPLRAFCNASVLAGAINGKNSLMKLLAATMTEPSEPTPIFLDFTDVEVATASFLRESVVSFRNLVRRRRSNFYPVLANMNDTVREEMIEVLRPGDVMMTCTLATTGDVISASPIGNLDTKQKLTFDIIQERGASDAAELMREYGAQENVKSTAWNNRLTSLAMLGLVAEVSEGRTKRYRALF